MGSTGQSLRSRWPALALFLAYLVVAVGPLVVATVIRGGPGQFGSLYDIGGAIALIVFPMLALQPMLSARLKWIERHFGLDRIFVFHKTMAVLAGILITSHPFLLASSSGNWSLLIGLAVPWYIWFGKIGLLTLLIMIVTSLLHKDLQLRYEHWRRLHNVLLLTLLVVAFVHSLNAGLDLQHWQMRMIWIPLLGMSASAYVYHRILGPVLRRKCAFRVSEVIRESRNVWTLRLKPPEGHQPLEYLPGQFQFLTFYRGRGLPSEEHPFTISSSSAEGTYHASTIKESGDFTATIGQTLPGDRVAVQAPFGRFTYLLYPDEHDLVFIAGGIGITPLMSMLRHMRDTQADLDVLLLYGNRAEDDIVFRAELEQIAQGDHPRLRVVHVLSAAGAQWSGERGHIDREVIARYVEGDLRSKTCYVCGPPAMMHKVMRTLLALGAPARRVRSERFEL